MTQAVSLVLAREGTSVVGDRAYDSDAFVEHIHELGMCAVIPARANRRVKRPHEASVYARRNVIERLFGRLKMFRRIATRYDKTAASFVGFLAVGAWFVALSGWA